MSANFLDPVAPQQVLDATHIQSVRRYLSHLAGNDNPFSQAVMAGVYGCNSNTYAKWERLEQPPPFVVLAMMQWLVHREHFRRGLYQDEAQSNALFLDFHSKNPRMAVLQSIKLEDLPHEDARRYVKSVADIAPHQELDASHLHTMRCYLAHLAGNDKPLKQSDMADILGCNSNSYAKWERLVQPAPAMTLKALQCLLHVTHFRLGLTRDEKQSNALFMSFEDTLMKTFPTRNSNITDYLPATTASIYTDELHSILFEGAFEFGGLMVDGYQLRLGSDPLTILRPFGNRGKVRLRLYPFDLLDWVLRYEHEREPGHKTLKRANQQLRQQIVTFDYRLMSEGQTVICERANFHMRDGEISVEIPDSQRRDWLAHQFECAGKQAWKVSQLDRTNPEVEERVAKIAAELLAQPRGAPGVMSYFISSDSRYRFNYLTYLEAGLAQILGRPIMSGQDIGIKLWSAMRLGQSEAKGAFFSVEIDGLDVRLRYPDTIRAALAKLC